MTAKKNIVLIGFMGSGKTVVGRAIARLGNYQFVDTDGEIEKVTGLTLPQLLKKYGQLRFRSEEELVLKKLQNRQDLVIATGGNVDLDSANLEVLKESGFFVLLEADPDVLYQRLCRKHERPIIGKKPTREKVQQLLAERNTFYNALADFKINTSKITVEEAAQAIICEFKNLQNTDNCAII